MKTKAQTSFMGYVFYSIVSAVIFLLVYSFWFSDSGITGNVIYEKAEQLKESIVNGISSLNFNLIQNRFICEENFQKGLKISRTKYPETKIKIIERKSFENLEEAVRYVELIGADNSPNSVKFLSNNFAVNFGRIDMVLIRLDSKFCAFGICDDDYSVSSTKFGICKNENKIVYPKSDSLVEGYMG